MHPALLLLTVACMSSFSVGRRRVYHLLTDQKNWTDAEKFCQDHYTDLTTVNNQTDVSSVCPEERGCENAWVRLDSTFQGNAKWKWIDDEFVDDDLRFSKIPENEKEGNCAYVKMLNETLMWYNRSCSEEGRFFCEDPNYEYSATHQTAIWCNALRFCESRGEQLVGKFGLDGNKNLNDAIKRFGGDLKWWVGLFRAPSGIMKDYFCSQSCAMRANNIWKSHNCSEPHPFICFDDHMVLVKKNFTWKDALVYCREHYGELAIMADEHLQKMVQMKAKMAATDHVWVGLHFSCFFEEWMWVNGHWVDSGDKNWDKQNDKHHCDVSGAMKKTGTTKWFKRSSQEQNNFVCSIHC